MSSALRMRYTFGRGKDKTRTASATPSLESNHAQKKRTIARKSTSIRNKNKQISIIRNARKKTVKL